MIRRIPLPEPIQEFETIVIKTRDNENVVETIVNASLKVAWKRMKKYMADVLIWAKDYMTKKISHLPF